MNVRRGLFALAGVMVVTAAFAVSSSVGEIVNPLITLMGSDYAFAGLIALIGPILAVVALVSGRQANLKQATMPEPEYPTEAPAPGNTLDDALTGTWIGLPVVGRKPRSMVRTRLRELAIGVLVRNGCSRSEAVTRVDRGTWTADDQVGRFLASDPKRVRVLSRYLAGIGARQPPFRRRVHQTLTALREIENRPVRSFEDTRSELDPNGS